MKWKLCLEFKVNIFIIQFHGITIKPNIEFQLPEIYVGKVFEIFPLLYTLVKYHSEEKLHMGLPALSSTSAGNFQPLITADGHPTQPKHRRRIRLKHQMVSSQTVYKWVTLDGIFPLFL